MNCLECHSGGEQSAAIGVCSQCGAAACHSHARVRDVQLTCTKPVARVVAVQPAARQLLCARCSAAHQAHAACCPPVRGARQPN
jgi:hypothetical protein